MEGTGPTGVGRCFVKAFLRYDSILRQEFDKGPQTLLALNKIHASATSTALAELEKLHNNCEQHPEALKQHRMQLLDHVENAFEARRRKVEQTVQEDKHNKTTEWENLEEIGALIRQNPQEFGLHQPTLADYQVQDDIIPGRTSVGTVDRASGDKEKTEVKNDSHAENIGSQQLQAELSKQKEKYESALKVLSKQLEQIKQQNAKLLEEKENTASTIQAQLEAQRQHHETLMQAQSEVQKQRYKELVKSHLEKIAQLEQERDQEANRRKSESEKLKAEVELYKENVQSMKILLENTMKINQELSEQHREQREQKKQKDEALRVKDNELRQLRDQQKRKESELKAQMDKLVEMQRQKDEALRVKDNELRQLKYAMGKLAEMQQRINRNHDPRQNFFEGAGKIIDQVVEVAKELPEIVLSPFVDAFACKPDIRDLEDLRKTQYVVFKKPQGLDD
ncbi:hypothetical protein CSKR_112393 [Clonorchis sinensis]|uniref:Uncharacterized protein n=1 Tax=Clonorchis sinensis TaxID=79923 RepID=A0A8T1MWP2_CLOSI|nr:hypothetical protein CSKR_112393 [Clonorchis sinensis]